MTIIVAESKCDVMKSGNGRLYFSAQSGENMDVLTKTVISEMRSVFKRKALESEEE